MKFKPQNVLLEGSTAGMLGGAAVAPWVLIVKLGRGGMLRRPAFLLVGGIASWLLKTCERHPAFFSGVVLLICVLEFFFLTLVGAVSQEALQTLIWWRVVMGNILATAVMLTFFADRHPWLVARLKTKLRHSRGLSRRKAVRQSKRAPSPSLPQVS